jgi:ATP-dependent DNA helicase pcrA
LDSLKQSGLLQKGFASVGKEKPDYKEGDRVSHMKFGEGTVLSLEEDKKDYLVTVLFDKAGQKKMMAGFAKLQKL